ncbi:hypothetical protein Tco_1167625 [Tanacetum coccineum]
MGSIQMDEDDEISNLVDLHMYMLCDGWKWQDLFDLKDVDGKISMLALVDHFGCILTTTMRVRIITIMRFYGCIPTDLNVCKMVEKVCEKWLKSDWKDPFIYRQKLISRFPLKWNQPL